MEKRCFSCHYWIPKEKRCLIFWQGQKLVSRFLPPPKKLFPKSTVADIAFVCCKTAPREWQKSKKIWRKKVTQTFWLKSHTSGSRSTPPRLPFGQSVPTPDGGGGGDDDDGRKEGRRHYVKIFLGECDGILICRYLYFLKIEKYDQYEMKVMSWEMI